MHGKNNDFTKKAHHHTGFEVHAVMSGEQTYEVCDKIHTVSSGELLIIPPNICHRVVSASNDAEKFSLCFDKTGDNELSYVYTKASDALTSAFLLIKEECTAPLAHSQMCVTSAILFALSAILRVADVKSTTESPPCYEHHENTAFTLARRYIEDNICADISTSDVADYCHFSAKQLTRIFEREAGLPLGAYIRRERSEKIRILLENGKLTLKEISETMNFKNEYYFNTFFKRNMGMAPSAYKKMVNK